jgi:hypothetical protein
MGRGRLRNLADDIFFQLRHDSLWSCAVQLACQLNASPWTDHVLGLVLVYIDGNPSAAEGWCAPGMFSTLGCVHAIVISDPRDIQLQCRLPPDYRPRASHGSTGYSAASCNVPTLLHGDR